MRSRAHEVRKLTEHITASEVRQGSRHWWQRSDLDN